MGHRIRDWEDDEDDFEPKRKAKSTIKAVFTAQSGFAKIHENYLRERGNNDKRGYKARGKKR